MSCRILILTANGSVCGANTVVYTVHNYTNYDMYVLNSVVYIN